MFRRKFLTLLVSIFLVLLGLSHSAYADDISWQWPVKGAVIAGYKLDSYYEAGQHRGIDIQAKEGDDVFAPADGVVKSLGNAFGKGMYITIDHGDMISTYNGLGKVLVSKNIEVKAGEPIAKINAAGFHESLGTSHLHFAIYIESSGSQRKYVDPAQLLPKPEPYQDQTDAKETQPSTTTESETQEIVTSPQTTNIPLPSNTAHSNEHIAQTNHTKNRSETVPSADKAFNISSKLSNKPLSIKSKGSEQPSLKPQQNNSPGIINARSNIKNGKTITKNNRLIQVPGHRTHVDLFRRNQSLKPLKNFESITSMRGKAGNNASESAASLDLSDKKSLKRYTSFFPAQPTPRKLPWKVFILIASLSLALTIKRDFDVSKIKNSISNLLVLGPNVKSLNSLDLFCQMTIDNKLIWAQT